MPGYYRVYFCAWNYTIVKETRHCSSKTLAMIENAFVYFTARSNNYRECTHYYRPQTKFAKVMFLHVSVILSTVGVGGGVPACIGGGIPGPHPGGKLRGLAWGVSMPTPRGESWVVWLGGGGFPGLHSGGVSQHALRQTPPAAGYFCGRYTSYWNAFLLRWGFKTDAC